MAFHAGTLEGLAECGILEQVGEVSSVSGGSIFAAAWAASLSERTWNIRSLLRHVRYQVRVGFERRAFYHPRLLRTALPGTSRTDLLAETFDRIFCPDMVLKDLPKKPAFLFNTSVLNHGQIGRFCREGFTSTGIRPPGDSFGPGVLIAMPDYPLSRAATASAAFPGMLPPLIIPRGPRHVPFGWGTTSAGIGARDNLALADGGVLENLGVEVFTFEWGGATCRDLVVSDAGPPKDAWKPAGLLRKVSERIVGFLAGLANLGLGAVSAHDLYRVALMMQAKEVRQMRHHTFDTLNLEILAQAQLTPPASVEADGTATKIAKGGPHPFTKRLLIFVSLDQDWPRLLRNLSRPWLAQLSADKKVKLTIDGPPRDSISVIQNFLSDCGIDLIKAKSLYDEMLRLRTPEQLGSIPTHFKGLHEEEIAALGLHARWQVHALKAIYWATL
jgi:predicted acylesterase/phospholipase RssA